MNKSEWRRTRPVFRALLCGVALFVIAKIAMFLFGFYARAQREAVAEAVVRDYLRATPNAKVVFVSINDADPSRAFLKKFSGGAPPVRAISQGTPLPNPLRDSWLVRYRDPKTQRDGVLLAIGEISWGSFWHARAAVWLPGRQEFYLAVKTSRGWKIVEHQQGIIE